MFWKRKARKRKKPEDRRKEPRQEDLSEIVIEYTDAEDTMMGKRVYQARARNASPGGLKFQSAVPYVPGAIVDIKLQSRRTGKLIQAKGKVRWVSSPAEGETYEVGVEFVETPIRSIMDLLEHIYKG